jgi:hypothetical protein
MPIPANGLKKIIAMRTQKENAGLKRVKQGEDLTGKMKPARWCRFITTASTMTTLLSQLCACAQTAPIYALQVKRMLA